MRDDVAPPQTEVYTDHEVLTAELLRWQDEHDAAFYAWALVIPVGADPFMVCGTNALSGQLRADDAVKACCNITQRFEAVTGPVGKAWQGTVCDVSALRPESHERNHVAEAMLTALAVPLGAVHYTGHLFGTVGFHMPNAMGLARELSNDQARRALHGAAAGWSADRDKREGA